MNSSLFTNPIFRMGKVVHTFVHEANIELERQDCLSFSLFIILLQIHCRGPLPQKDLATRIAHSGAAISRQIRKLENDSLIERTQGQDRRNLLITITQKGVAHLDLCEETIAPVLDKYLNILSIEEQKQLSTILNTLTN